LTQFTYNRVLVALIIAGLLAAVTIDWQRHSVETRNSRVETVMDYEEVVELAQMDGIAVPDMMHRLKEAGLTSLAIYEMTLEKLQKSGKLTVIPGADLLARYRTGERGTPLFLEDNGLIDPAKVYIFADRNSPGDQSFFEELTADLARRLGPDRIHPLTVTDRRLAVAVDTNFEKTLKWNLGLPSYQMKEAVDNGFLIIARPSNYTKVKPDDVNAVFARLSPFAANVSGLMFVGEEALGYPNLLPLTSRLLDENSYSLYMIEHPVQLQFTKQEGMLAIAAATGYRAARVTAIPKEEQPKITVATAVDRWALADQERNIRVNLLRNFEKADSGRTLSETNLRYVSGIKQAVQAKGFTLGRAAVFPPYFASPWLLAIVILGATAAGVLFLTLVWPFAPRYQYMLLGVIALVLIIPVLAGKGTLTRQATALVSAVLFPVLAMTWQLDRWRRQEPHKGSALSRILTDGLGGLVITTFLSLAGGLYLGSVLADVRFLLEIEIFRGVKFTFLLPLILVTVVYVVRYNPLGGEPVDSPAAVIRELRRVLDYPIYVKTLLLFAAGAGAALIYIGRSGHTAGVPVPAVEVKLRTFLEQAMYARPREKEFLIGHPAFFLAVMALYRQWPRLFHYILVVVATIGQGSLVETFAHLRTPIFMSFVRGLDGLAVGAVLGILAVVAVQLLHYFSFLLGRRTVPHE
jgi:hypothetical protein